MKPKQEPFMSAAQKSRLMMWVGIISFAVSMLGIVITGTVTATKLNEKVNQHEKRLDELQPVNEKMDEIKFNLKKLMERNGVEYTTVK